MNPFSSENGSFCTLNQVVGLFLLFVLEEEQFICSKRWLFWCIVILITRPSAPLLVVTFVDSVHLYCYCKCCCIFVCHFVDRLITPVGVPCSFQYKCYLHTKCLTKKFSHFTTIFQNFKMLTFRKLCLFSKYTSIIPFFYVSHCSYDNALFQSTNRWWTNKESKKRTTKEFIHF